MFVSVSVKEQTFLISCGPATQSLRWLADVACLRYDRHLGRSLGAPLGLRTTQDSVQLDWSRTISSSLKHGDAVVVVLNREVEEEWQNSTWSDWHEGPAEQGEDAEDEDDEEEQTKGAVGERKEMLESNRGTDALLDDDSTDSSDSKDDEDEDEDEKDDDEDEEALPSSRTTEASPKAAGSSRPSIS